MTSGVMSRGVDGENQRSSSQAYLPNDFPFDSGDATPSDSVSISNFNLFCASYFNYKSNSSLLMPSLVNSIMNNDIEYISNI